MDLKLFDSPYNPKETEGRIYKLWEKSGFFNPDKLPGRRIKKFSVMMAPPNITGSLHIGHVLENTETDILVRMKRMRGHKTLWLPGIDHAGIATQNVVEKDLKKQGIRRQDLGREKFTAKVEEWKDKYGAVILDQLKTLGVSSDWSRTRYTMDADYAKAVAKVFSHYRAKNWIYRGERVINWCPRCETGISDLEVEYREEKGNLYQIKYPLADEPGYITVATTRPETMLSDTAVAVNPKDKRYRKLIGKFAILPILERKIPIIADESVDMKFGTGAVKITPAHDVADFEISLRHDLPKIQVIDKRGVMTENAGAICVGLKTGDCRQKVIEKLKELGFLEKTDDYIHNVAYCERCGAKIEPRLSSQWFLKMSELAKLAIKAIKNKKTIIIPQKWQRILNNRLKNERDWNISRQLWWGHKIPIDGETDVLDTWFSSALWPFAALGWPVACVQNQNLKLKTKNYCKPLRGSDLAEYYPTDYISSARDILNIWIAKMIFSGMEFTGKSPFKIARIHATILNKEGKRMSKSLGTGIDPLLLIEKYGADAVRFGVIYQNLGGQDIRFNEDAMLTGKKFANKIWNASRFVLLAQRGKSEIPARNASHSDAGGRNPKSETNSKYKILNTKYQTEADKKMLAGLKKTTAEIGNLIEKYEFGRALRKLYDFFWHEYADIYIETAKIQMTDKKLKISTQNILLKIHLDLLKLLHPFLPFITEEIWSAFGKKNLLLVEDWPK